MLEFKHFLPSMSNFTLPFIVKKKWFANYTNEI